MTRKKYDSLQKESAKRLERLNVLEKHTYAAATLFEKIEKVCKVLPDNLKCELSIYLGNFRPYFARGANDHNEESNEFSSEINGSNELPVQLRPSHQEKASPTQCILIEGSDTSLESSSPCNVAPPVNESITKWSNEAKASGFLSVVPNVLNRGEDTTRNTLKNPQIEALREEDWKGSSRAKYVMETANIAFDKVGPEYVKSTNAMLRKNPVSMFGLDLTPSPPRRAVHIEKLIPESKTPEKPLTRQFVKKDARENCSPLEEFSAMESSALDLGHRKIPSSDPSQFFPPQDAPEGKVSEHRPATSSPSKYAEYISPAPEPTVGERKRSARRAVTSLPISTSTWVPKTRHGAKKPVDETDTYHLTNECPSQPDQVDLDLAKNKNSKTLSDQIQTSSVQNDTGESIEPKKLPTSSEREKQVSPGFATSATGNHTRSTRRALTAVPAQGIQRRASIPLREPACFLKTPRSQDDSAVDQKDGEGGRRRSHRVVTNPTVFDAHKYEPHKRVGTSIRRHGPVCARENPKSQGNTEGEEEGDGKLRRSTRVVIKPTVFDEKNLEYAAKKSAAMSTTSAKALDVSTKKKEEEEEEDAMFQDEMTFLENVPDSELCAVVDSGKEHISETLKPGVDTEQSQKECEEGQRRRTRVDTKPTVFDKRKLEPSPENGASMPKSPAPEVTTKQREEEFVCHDELPAIEISHDQSNENYDKATAERAGEEHVRKLELCRRIGLCISSDDDDEDVLKKKETPLHSIAMLDVQVQKPLSDAEQNEGNHMANLTLLMGGAKDASRVCSSKARKSLSRAAVAKTIMIPMNEVPMKKRRRRVHSTSATQTGKTNETVDSESGAEKNGKLGSLKSMPTPRPRKRASTQIPQKMAKIRKMEDPEFHAKAQLLQFLQTSGDTEAFKRNISTHMVVFRKMSANGLTDVMMEYLKICISGDMWRVVLDLKKKSDVDGFQNIEEQNFLSNIAVVSDLMDPIWKLLKEKILCTVTLQKNISVAKFGAFVRVFCNALHFSSIDEANKVELARNFLTVIFLKHENKRILASVYCLLSLAWRSFRWIVEEVDIDTEFGLLFRFSMFQDAQQREVLRWILRCRFEHVHVVDVKPDECKERLLESIRLMEYFFNATTDESQLLILKTDLRGGNICIEWSTKMKDMRNRLLLLAMTRSVESLPGIYKRIQQLMADLGKMVNRGEFNDECLLFSKEKLGKRIPSMVEVAVAYAKWELFEALLHVFLDDKTSLTASNVLGQLSSLSRQLREISMKQKEENAEPDGDSKKLLQATVQKAVEFVQRFTLFEI